MRSETCPAYICEIFVAGPKHAIEDACAKFCFEVGLCVSVEAVRFIYTGGVEDGFVVRLVNYPRFPSTPEEIRQKAERLAKILVEAAHQHSVLIMDRDRAEWFTRRADGP